jgi:quercetin dioxygenase-like cupin family protein
MECCLATGELIRLNGGARGLRLRCTTGRVWLTKNDGQDYLINAGRSFELSAGENALLEALNPAGIFMLETLPAAAIAAVRLVAC